VLPLTVGIRDGVVQLVSTLGSVVISARAELGSIITSALPVATVLICQRVPSRVAERDQADGAGGGRERRRSATHAPVMAQSCQWPSHKRFTRFPTCSLIPFTGGAPCIPACAGLPLVPGCIFFWVAALGGMATGALAGLDAAIIGTSYRAFLFAPPGGTLPSLRVRSVSPPVSRHTVCAVGTKETPRGGVSTLSALQPASVGSQLPPFRPPAQAAKLGERSGRRSSVQPPTPPQPLRDASGCNEAEVAG
jgi:hypothetical protein